MSFFERPPSAPVTPIEVVPEIEDFRDNEELYKLLIRLPSELRDSHLKRIAHLNDEEATGYLYELHERREGALRESVVSDESLEGYFTAHQEEIWKALETRVFEDEESVVGRGTTAKITRFNMRDIDPESDSAAPEVAIKYLISPNEHTINVSAEHDLISEVEQLRKIELAEEVAGANKLHIRVPHPYFYYRKGKTQCYAMELIDGMNLDAVETTVRAQDLKEELRGTLADIDREALMEEIDVFFDAMHKVCLHGDVKRGNMMISRDGHFYVIDFGNSKLLTSVSDTHTEALEEAKDSEKKKAKRCVQDFLKELYENQES
ncbi:MAG: hypothetical protein JWL88_809 [Parcubacteria group bacterium]|nr:hypothetical protein [Parcubacteria group bacterium]